MAASLLISGSASVAAVQTVGDGRVIGRRAAGRPARPRQTSANLSRSALPSDVDAEEARCNTSLGRRQALVGLPALSLALQMSIGAQAEEGVEEVVAAPASKKKVVVLGGNGFVGSRVCKSLVDTGCEVISVSRSGTPPSWAAGKEAWVDSVTWAKADVLTEDISSVLKGAAAVVSCIGVIGGSYDYMQKGNGAVNAAAAQKAKAAGVPKFVYVSVASIVPNSVSGLVGGTDFKGYFDGKKEAEAAIEASFPGSAVVVKPSFIYGGSEFGLSPPRVAGGYGSAIEGLLSSSPIHALAQVMPGPIALTLEPPVSVESVAAAAAGGALGILPPGSIDGTESINAAATAFASA